MIILCQEKSQIQKAIDYIGQNYVKVPYCYLNLKRYGINNPNVKVWLDIKESVQGVYLLYYDCLHFTTFEIDYPCEQIVGMIQATEPRTIMLQGGIGERLEFALMDTFDIEKNYIMDLSVFVNGEKSSRVELASRKDMYEIVQLMMKDQEYTNVYDEKVLLQQMLDRFDDGFARFFVIRDDKKIVANFCTYGEVKGFAILGGLLVHPLYRRKGLASEIFKHSVEVLSIDGFRTMDFVNYRNKASLELHKKMGAKSISSLFKFVRKTV